MFSTIHGLYVFWLPTSHVIVTVFFSTDLHSAAVESESDVAGSYKKETNKKTQQINNFKPSIQILKCYA